MATKIDNDGDSDDNNDDANQFYLHFLLQGTIAESVRVWFLNHHHPDKQMVKAGLFIILFS